MLPLLCAAIVFLFTGPAAAELIEMKDGRVFEGELVTETDDSMRISEIIGDGSIESDYEKSQVIRIGDRIVTEVEESGEKEGPAVVKKAPAIDFESKERIAYENSVKDICDEIRRARNLWDMGHANYESLREWYIRFEAMRDRFRERYGKTFVSYSFVNTVFVEAGHFMEAIDAMRKLEDSAGKNSSASWKQRFRQCQRDNERIASEALAKTISYATMAKEKVLKR